MMKAIYLQKSFSYSPIWGEANDDAAASSSLVVVMMLVITRSLYSYLVVFRCNGNPLRVRASVSIHSSSNAFHFLVKLEDHFLK